MVDVLGTYITYIVLCYLFLLLLLLFFWVRVMMSGVGALVGWGLDWIGRGET